ncbi:Crp/Fnr family transcriptional regulator [Microscilla marina]|uniref:Putative cAMP-binding domain, regulatory protein n=1 Tax=Microscilla marina ATCC 23134 TaxID=313606 RepID=A1ZTJ5_MICM2|nr:Crp/Fnr family transcriptional regulator [Microscilla marina]EAY26255.1 putative cAMP-binding domain, regulatory protein [Microscilla marina ATCC 23134]
MKRYSTIQNQDEVNHLFQVFFDYVRLLTAIPQSDQDYCRQLFEPVYAPKNTLLETQGTVHKYHNFIVSGFIRNYHLDGKQREVTIDINDGPRFFTSYNHFVHQTVSNENLHCITDCKLLRISRENVSKARDVGITSQEYSEKMLQYYVESSKQRMIDLTTLTAKERYLKLMHNRPTIIKNVPLIYIASYLGINPGSLSRIRQEI